MRTVALSDYAEVFNGKTPSKAEQRESGHPVLKIRDVDDKGQFRQRYGSFVDPAFAEKFSKKQVKAGDTLILNAAHNADYVGSKSFFATVEVDGAIATGEWLIVRPRSGLLDARFASHWLTSDQARREIRELVKGIHLYPKDVARLSIPLPPLDEQKRIAAILDQADELRRKRQRAIDRLCQLGQAIFHEMFGDLLASNDAMVELGAICDVRDGTHDSPKYVEEGHPLLTSKNFSGGQIDYDGAKLISDEDFVKVNKRSKVEEGDIVMPMIGTIGSPVIVDFDPDFAIKNVALIKFQGNGMNAEFVRQVLDSSLFKAHVANKGRGGTQKFVSLGDIRKFLIPKPDPDHQEDFADRIRSLKIEQKTLRTSMDLIESLYSSLQHRAFRGEL